MIKLLNKSLTSFGKFIMLMGRTFKRPERLRMFAKEYIKEMAQLGVNSIGIVLLISFFIGAVICIQMKLNIQSPWMPRWVSGYTTREIMLLEFSSSIMCLILAGKVGSNIASEIGTMRVTQQIDALDIMGVNSANYLILPKIVAMVTIMPILSHLLVGNGYHGCLRHGIYWSYHRARRPDARHPACFQVVVRMDEYHQEPVLCLYHICRPLFLRLYGGGWLGECGQGIDGCRGMLQCADPVQ